MSERTNTEPAQTPAMDLGAQTPAMDLGAQTPAMDATSAAPLGQALAAAPQLAPPTLPLGEAIAPPRPTSPLLRLWRALAGVSALAAAWGFVLLLVLLAAAVGEAISSRQTLLMRVGVGLLGALGALWLATAMLACVLAGSYCLMLAITRRHW
ncbi:MAG: hypothetical protein IVW57_05135 [Ktedonobacterales bacterium]|nr:hypothetical protein [Ktedonobacterales bacterium]